MRVTLPVLALLFLAGQAVAQTSYPMISSVRPTAVQRGKAVALEVGGTQNFAGAYKVLFEGSGLAAEIVPPKGKAPETLRAVPLALTVAADTAAGVREFRVVSRLGVSSVGQLVVSEHPVVEEKGDNNTPAKANPITAPCTVSGRIEAAEDVDTFRFHARAGQTFTFEIHCARLQDKIHDLQKHADPILTLSDASGRELAANDDTYFADSLLAYTFQQEGDYLIQVRDAKYDGDPRWGYALLVTDGPYASHVYPAAAQAGRPVELEPVGSAAKARGRVPVTAPRQPGLHEVVLDTPAGKTPPVPLLVSDLPQALETEPNDTVAAATRVTLPCGLNGRIAAPGDVDHFVFAARKGQPLRFEVKARRFGTQLRSNLDSMLELLNTRGVVLASNDDTTGKDAALTFTPTADGDYVLRVRDLNSKGGPEWVYHVEAEPARPDFVLRCDGDKAMIGPGSRTAWYVKLTRLHGFTGPVKIDVQGLPQGVTVNPLTIQPGQLQGLLVLSASPDAAIDTANVRVSGSAEVETGGKTQTLVRPVEVTQEIYFPGGGRGVFPVNLQTVAVTEPSDILEVAVSPAVLVLKPGGEVRLDVTVKRKPGFDKGVTLDVLLRHLGQVFGNTLPPGVSVVEAKSKTLLGAASKGHLVLKADATAAPVEGVPVSVLAQVSINFVVKVSYSSAALPLSVRR